MIFKKKPKKSMRLSITILFPIALSCFGFPAAKTNSTGSDISDELIASESIIVLKADTPLTSNEIDSPARPVGGLEEFYNFIGQNYVYPKEAQLAKVKGRVLISFVIERDGTVTDIKILRDLGYGTGEAAVKMLEKSPKWKPGIQKGKPVRVQFTLPLQVHPGVQENKAADSTITEKL